jgi:hypothetical protein
MQPRPRLVLYTTDELSADTLARLQSVLASRAVPCQVELQRTQGQWSYRLEGTWPPPTRDVYEELSDVFSALGLP